MDSQRQMMIKKRLKECIRSKFHTYMPETSNMPFHHRLLGKDRMALYAFIQSLNTTFGVSIYEPVALELARGRFRVAETQVKPAATISTEAHQRIQAIVDGLVVANREPNILAEIEEIREVCLTGTLNTVKLTQVDIWLESQEGELFLIDLKTVKPNVGGFLSYK